MTINPRLAFILCAGTAERLQPLSGICPKPLLPLVDQPIVFHIVKRLADTGVTHFIFNVHVHCDYIKNELTKLTSRLGLKPIFIEEPELLNTGGALLNAKEFLTEPFWLVNSDIVAEDFPFDEMKKCHDKMATLSVRPEVDSDMFNPVGVNDSGHLVRVEHVFGTGGFNRQFLGVHILSEECTEYIPDKKIHGIFQGLYLNLHNAGIDISTYEVTKAFTGDPGTFKGYLEANRYVLNARHIDNWISPECVIGKSVTIEKGSIISRGCKVGNHSRINNSVILPDIIIPENTSITNSIVARTPADDMISGMLITDTAIKIL